MNGITLNMLRSLWHQHPFGTLSWVACRTPPAESSPSVVSTLVADASRQRLITKVLGY